MDFLAYLKTSAEDINLELENFLQEWQKRIGEENNKIDGLSKVFTEACDGGKRLRGTFVKLGFELTGKEYTPEILKPAASYEIFQTSILAHDDIIDKSPLRRGKPTIWKILGENDYALSQTICLGDIGFFLSYKLILESNFPDRDKNKGATFFTHSMLNTGLGQMLDIELPKLSGKIDITEEDILTVFRLKTAHYTLVGPLQLGAVFGSGDQSLLKDINEFGEYLGIAFQIQDDILGIFGDEKTLGKSVTSDVEEGKITLLYLHTLKNGSTEQKVILDKYYGKGEIGESELEQIRQTFKESGALEYSQKKAAELVEKAQGIIKEMKVPEDKRNLLLQMAEFLVKRDK